MRAGASDPAVSVILPVYNAAAYVGAAVESILAQTFRDFELIVLDDGSTDGSGKILQELVARDARIRLLQRENRGLVATLNEMLQCVRGKYVARMDADDLSLPERLAQQVAYLDAHPPCVAVGCRVILADANMSPLQRPAFPTGHDEIDVVHLRGEGGAMQHPACMFRKAALDGVGGYREEYRHAEDNDLFLRLAEIGALANVNECLYIYRQHAGSVSNMHAAAQRAAARAAAADARKRRGLASVEDAGDPLAAANGGDVSALHIRWAWWALGSGHVATARKHAVSGVLAAPWRLGHWKALACALRGH